MQRCTRHCDIYLLLLTCCSHRSAQSRGALRGTIITPDEQPVVQSTEVSSDGDVPAIPDDFDSDEAKALRDKRTYFNREELLRMKKIKRNYKGKGDWWTSPELDQDLRKKQETFKFHKRAWKEH